MSECCEREDNSCSRCVRNSPIASLIGFIMVLLGAGAFGGATIFARRYLLATLNEPNLLGYLDYVIYGIIGIVGLFSLVAYFVCAISSGVNAKHCFESSRRAACGRFCNLTLLISLVLAILIWSAILCLSSYTVVSIGFLMHRQNGPERILLAQLVTSNTPVPASDFSRPRITRQIQEYRPNEYNQSESIDSLDNLAPIQNEEEQYPTFQLPTPHERSNSEDLYGIQSSVSRSGLGTPIHSLNNAKALFHRCDSESVDLSYYGLYDANELPIRLTLKDFEHTAKDIMICACIATAGIYIILLGYIQILICTAMNYKQLQEKRYYEISDNEEEQQQDVRPSLNQ